MSENSSSQAASFFLTLTSFVARSCAFEGRSEASETTEGYLVRILATEKTTISEDKNKLVWDTGFGSITELIKSASGNYKLTVALVRSRANSLGFKTEKGNPQNTQKRLITCEISVFESLKKRYIPFKDDQDDQDDQDDRVGPGEKILSQEEDKSGEVREETSGGDIDRLNRLNRLNLDGIEAERRKAEELARQKEEHNWELAAKHTKSKFNREKNNRIEWSQWSWNPVTGCNFDCEYCYARDIANDLYPEKFAPTFRPERLDAPNNTPVPDNPNERHVFVCSMAELFGNWVPQDWLDQVLARVREHSEWTFIFLTKNPKRLVGVDWPINAWVGTTVDIQAGVNGAEAAFKEINASVKFLSCEPMQEQLTFSDLSMFNWIIIGGRSKNSKVPEFKPPKEWIDSLVNSARESGLKIYQKPNLGVTEATRLREYPEAKSEKKIRWTEQDEPPRTKSKKIVPLRFLIDFAGYKKDDVVGIKAEGDLSARPNICELITCGQCPTAIQGAKPVCDPCIYLGKAEA